MLVCTGKTASCVDAQLESIWVLGVEARGVIWFGYSQRLPVLYIFLARLAVLCLALELMCLLVLVLVCVCVD